MPKVRRQTVADQGLQVLRGRIVDGELKPGDAVTEEAMAREIGISRPTMREVLNTLIGEGLLTRHPSTRVLQVTTLGDEEIHEIYVARTLLELGGVDAAAGLEDSELQLLEQIMAQMQQAAADNDIYALVRADARCHAQTVAFLHSRYLSELHAQLMAKLNLRISQLQTTETHDAVAQVLRPHQKFCALVMDRDTEGAKSNLRARLDQAEREVLESSSAQTARPLA